MWSADAVGNIVELELRRDILATYLWRRGKYCVVYLTLCSVEPDKEFVDHRCGWIACNPCHRGEPPQ